MLGRQAKVLSAGQMRAVELHLASSQNAYRNLVIFLLSARAGLRAKEIAELSWSMITDAAGNIGSEIRLTDAAAKGTTGGTIPIAGDLRSRLEALRLRSIPIRGSDRVIRTRRSRATTAQVIVNMFAGWYRDLGFEGCSSHSGRRTFITRAARNISRVGGSMRDVQALVRHSSLAMTQRYIEIDSEAMRKVVDL